MPTIFDDLSAGESPVLIPDLPDEPYWPRRRGRKAHKCKGFRCVQTGKGGVRLEAIKTPGGLATTRSAVLRFFAALTDPDAAARPPARTAARRERAIASAENELRAEGIC